IESTTHNTAPVNHITETTNPNMSSTNQISGIAIQGKTTTNHHLAIFTKNSAPASDIASISIRNTSAANQIRETVTHNTTLANQNAATDTHSVKHHPPVILHRGQLLSEVKPSQAANNIASVSPTHTDKIMQSQSYNVDILKSRQNRRTKRSLVID